MPEEEKRYLPLEKREIRGLTLENIIKYGVFLMMAVFGYFSMQKKIDDCERRVDDLDAKILVIRTDNETLKIKVQTQETTVARLEERINQNTARIK